MTFQLQCFGATEQVTGSLYVVRTTHHAILLECGLIQGTDANEEQNWQPFPIDTQEIDAVVLSHAHIDHSGRIPQLVKSGFTGPIYTHHASYALCRIMLPDCGYLNEKDAQWKNKRQPKNPVYEPLYTQADAQACLELFRGVGYREPTEILSGLWLTLHDAGHILGSAIVELTCKDEGKPGTLVFSGDLGFSEAPVMDPPARLKKADVVLMESTYGDRCHRPFAETMLELAELFETARAARGNILIPAFTVGRTQDLLYLMSENYRQWQLDQWHIFLDSPMGIEATEAYSDYRELYGASVFEETTDQPRLANFHTTRSTAESIAINRIQSGAIIIAGSGMCSGGRILHHLKNNVEREECHIVFVGFQAAGTLGRRIVDGAESIKLWGETLNLRAQVHTIGGLSAHADQAGLVEWYNGFEDRPPVYLVHGEERAQVPLKNMLETRAQAPVQLAVYGQKINIGDHNR